MKEHKGITLDEYITVRDYVGRILVSRSETEAKFLVEQIKTLCEWEAIEEEHEKER